MIFWKWKLCRKPRAKFADFVGIGLIKIYMIGSIVPVLKKSLKSSISLHLTHQQLKWCHYKNVPTVWPHLNCELNIIGAVQNVVGGREERYLLLHPEKILINTLATCRHCCVCGNLIFGCVQKRLRRNLGVNVNEHVYRVQCRTRV